MNCGDQYKAQQLIRNEHYDSSKKYFRCEFPCSIGVCNFVGTFSELIPHTADHWNCHLYTCQLCSKQIFDLNETFRHTRPDNKTICSAIQRNLTPHLPNRTQQVDLWKSRNVYIVSVSADEYWKWKDKVALSNPKKKTKNHRSRTPGYNDNDDEEEDDRIMDPRLNEPIVPPTRNNSFIANRNYNNNNDANSAPLGGNRFNNDSRGRQFQNNNNNNPRGTFNNRFNRSQSRGAGDYSNPSGGYRNRNQSRERSPPNYRNPDPRLNQNAGSIYRNQSSSSSSGYGSNNMFRSPPGSPSRNPGSSGYSNPRSSNYSTLFANPRSVYSNPGRNAGSSQSMNRSSNSFKSTGAIYSNDSIDRSPPASPVEAPESSSYSNPRSGNSTSLGSANLSMNRSPPPSSPKDQGSRFSNLSIDLPPPSPVTPLVMPTMETMMTRSIAKQNAMFPLEEQRRREHTAPAHRVNATFEMCKQRATSSRTSQEGGTISITIQRPEELKRVRRSSVDYRSSHRSMSRERQEDDQDRRAMEADRQANQVIGTSTVKVPTNTSRISSLISNPVPPPSKKPKKTIKEKMNNLATKIARTQTDPGGSLSGYSNPGASSPQPVPPPSIFLGYHHRLPPGVARRSDNNDRDDDDDVVNID